MKLDKGVSNGRMLV